MLKHTSEPWHRSEFINSPKYNHMSKKWKKDNENEERKRVYAGGKIICRCDSNGLIEDHANALSDYRLRRF